MLNDRIKTVVAIIAIGSINKLLKILKIPDIPHCDAGACRGVGVYLCAWSSQRMCHCQN